MRGLTIGLAAGALLISAPAASATYSAAYTPGAVTVATNAGATSTLELLGVSDTAYAAARTGTGVVATHSGPTLTGYGAAYNPATAQNSDLTDGILRWAERKGTAWVIHRENVFGGGKQDIDSADQPLAHTPDSYLGYASGTLKRHVFGGATTTLLTGLTQEPIVRADSRGAVVLYHLTVAGTARTRVGLVTFGRTGIEMLTEHVDSKTTGETAATVALTPNSVVWYSKKLPVDVLGVFHRRSRAGGAVSSADSPAQRSGGQVVATDTEIATTSGTPAKLWVFTSPTWRQISLPDGTFGGLRSSAATIAFAMSGDDATTAGVYKIGPGTASTLVARPEPRPGTVTGVGLRAGLLTFGTATVTKQATVSSGGALTVGPPVTVTPPVGRRSGAYTLLNHRVYRGGTQLLDLTSRRCRGEDLYGSLAVCNQPDGTNVMIDAEGRFPTGTTAGSGTGEIAVWGTTVAWTSSATQISVQDLAVAGSKRTIDLSTRVHGLRLSEGAISLTDDDGYLELVDRANPAAGPVLLALRAPAAADDHLVAGIANDTLQVRTLPFGLTAKYRPRLVDAIVPTTVSGTWTPVFHVSKPVTNVKVTIRRGATVVAALAGPASSGADGAIGDVSWNAAGAPRGTYTWTLTADARDGDGAITYVDGTSAVAGTIYL